MDAATVEEEDKPVSVVSSGNGDVCNLRKVSSMCMMLLECSICLSMTRRGHTEVGLAARNGMPGPWHVAIASVLNTKSHAIGLVHLH